MAPWIFITRRIQSAFCVLIKKLSNTAINTIVDFSLSLLDTWVFNLWVIVHQNSDLYFNNVILFVITLSPAVSL